VFLVLAVQRSLDGLRVDEEEEQPGGDGEHLVGRERSGSNVNAGKRTVEGVAGERRGILYSRSGTEVPEDDEHSDDPRS
jgi:hypothetical protein